jgi:prepilin peptidase CpaA
MDDWGPVLRFKDWPFLWKETMLVVLAMLLTGVVLVTTVMACVSDVRSLRIPNLYSVIVIGAFALAFAAAPESFGKLSAHVLSLVIIFLITYIMFVSGLMGGGDAKFGSALALWVGLPGIVSYVFWMTLMGGLIAALSLLIKNRKPFSNPAAGSWVAQVQDGRNAVPYGIAISFGAWAALLHTGFVTHQLDEVIKIIH